MAQYSPPFRLCAVRDLTTGKRRQFTDRKAAEKHAGAVQAQGHRVEVKSSKCLYTRVYRPATRRTERINTGETTKYGAERWIQERIRNGRAPSRQKHVEMSEAIDLWLDELRVLGRSEKTMADYRIQTKGSDPDAPRKRGKPWLENHWAGFFSGRSIAEITREDLIAFFKARSTIVSPTGKKRRASPRLLNQNRTLLKAFFSWACKQNLTDFNPVEDIPRWKEVKREPRILDEDEVAALLHACREPFTIVSKRNGKWRPYERKIEGSPPGLLYPIVVTGLLTMLRRQNVLDLEWDDVDLTKGTLLLSGERTKQRSDVFIPLAPSLKSVLLGLPREGRRVFPLDGFKRSFRSAMRRAGIEDFSFHGLRRTSADHLLRNGVRTEVVERLGGWSHGKSVLMNHYRKVAMNELRGAVAILDQLLNPVKTIDAKAPAVVS